jgi:hypothetical protein
MIRDQWRDAVLRAIEQDAKTGDVWVRAMRGDVEILLLVDLYFVPVMARQVKRMFPAPSEAAQTAKLDRQLRASVGLRLVKTEPACRHDYADGDVCSKCDQIRPLRGAR